MELYQLPKITQRSKKRLGRGLGSGKGKTGGRGTKGQKARGKVAKGFIGGTLPMYKKLPYRRGFGNKKSNSNMLILSLSKLSIFEDNSEVGVQQLIEKGLLKEKKVKKYGVKITGVGDITKKLIINLPTTKGAALKIKKAGGKISGE